MKKQIIGLTGKRIIDLSKYTILKANQIVRFYENHKVFVILTVGE